MTVATPLRLVKDAEAIVLSSLSGIDVYLLEHAEQKLIHKLRNQFIDIKLYIRDYELSETLLEQQGFMKKVHSLLDLTDKNILKLSESNILSAVDVAQISAHFAQAREDIS